MKSQALLANLIQAWNESSKADPLDDPDVLEKMSALAQERNYFLRRDAKGKNIIIGIEENPGVGQRHRLGRFETPVIRGRALISRGIP